MPLNNEIGWRRNISGGMRFWLTVGARRGGADTTRYEGHINRLSESFHPFHPFLPRLQFTVPPVSTAHTAAVMTQSPEHSAPTSIMVESVPASIFDSFAAFANEPVIPFRFSSASVGGRGWEGGPPVDSRQYGITKQPSLETEESKVNARGDEVGDDGYSGDSEREISRAEAYKLQILKRWRVNMRDRKLLSFLR